MRGYWYKILIFLLNYNNNVVVLIDGIDQNLKMENDSVYFLLLNKY